MEQESIIIHMINKRKELFYLGKQFNFIIDKETESLFFQFIKENGEALFEGSNEKPIILNELPLPFSGKCWFKIYLYNKNYGDLIYNTTSSGRVYIESLDSPVIEYLRTIIKDNSKEISKGRLWFENKYYNKHDKLINKDIRLEEWYKILCTWIKQNLIKIDVINNGKTTKEYVSKPILQLLENGYRIV